MVYNGILMKTIGNSVMVSIRLLLFAETSFYNMLNMLTMCYNMLTACWNMLESCKQQMLKHAKTP